MSIARDRLRWNGWGRLGESFELSATRRAAVLEELGRRLGRDVTPQREPVSFDELVIPPSRLGESVLARLRAACGDDGVRVSGFERASRATGRSLPDLLRLRRGELRAVPDAVLLPPDEGAVAAALRIAADAQIAVVPFGGGTSVVGGVEPRPGDGHRGCVALDTTRLDALVRLDAASGVATFQAGIDGPALEATLRARGFTLGHYPQSFEHSTLGGWIATRSSGQFSGRYGAIEDVLVCLRVVTPEGVLRTLQVPRSAAGPDLNQLMLGSEGTLGVIVEASVRVRPAPAREQERGALLHDFGRGADAIHEIESQELPLTMCRLSDAGETELFRILRRDPARRVDATELALGAATTLGYGAGRCALIYGAAEAGAAPLRRVLSQARRVLRAHGALALGPAPGRSWRRDRFRTPYLRDWLLDHDVAVDSFETALPWSRLDRGHERILRSVGTELESHAGGGLVMGHLSHSYRDGACLYFTLVYPVDPAHDVKQWESIKAGATEAVLAAGGTLSHHHGVGSDHAPWMIEEKGSVGLRALRGLKSALDPGGILNPGKLL